MLWSEFKKMVDEKLMENNVEDALISLFDFNGLDIGSADDVGIMYNSKYNLISVIQ